MSSFAVAACLWVDKITVKLKENPKSKRLVKSGSVSWMVPGEPMHVSLSCVCFLFGTAGGLYTFTRPGATDKLMPGCTWNIESCHILTKTSVVLELIELCLSRSL